MKPSTDQVLTKTPGGLGFFERCVSRSAIWMPLTPTWAIRAAHSSRVLGCGTFRRMSAATFSRAFLASQEAMPGLAPQQETAVVEPGARARLAASVISRSA